MQAIMMARAGQPSAVPLACKVCMFLQRISIRAKKSPGTLSIFNPKKSLICVLAIMTASHS